MNSSGWALIYNVFVGYTSTVYRESQKLFGRYKMFKLLRQVQMWCQDLILILCIVYGKRSRVQNLNMAVSKRYLPDRDANSLLCTLARSELHTGLYKGVTAWKK